MNHNTADEGCYLPSAAEIATHVAAIRRRRRIEAGRFATIVRCRDAGLSRDGARRFVLRIEADPLFTAAEIEAAVAAALCESDPRTPMREEARRGKRSRRGLPLHENPREEASPARTDRPDLPLHETLLHETPEP